MNEKSDSEVEGKVIKDMLKNGCSPLEIAKTLNYPIHGIWKRIREVIDSPYNEKINREDGEQE